MKAKIEIEMDNAAFEEPATELARILRDLAEHIENGVMRTTARERAEVVARLIQLGISFGDAEALRRIAKTLRSWFELECGTGDERVTRSIERDEESSYVCTQCGHKGFGKQAATCNCEQCGDPAPVRHIGDGKPYLRVQYMGRNNQWIDRRSPIPDREAGARKRLAAIMASYKRKLVPYIQGDCRGASLYICRKADVNGHDIDSVYTRGIAVY